MTLNPISSSLGVIATAIASHATPAGAAGTAEPADRAEGMAIVLTAAPKAATAAADAATQVSQPADPAAPAPAAAALPRGVFKPVFDDTWITIGLGAGMVPSYAGSNDYIAFPLPLIVGRVGGVGISPNGPGFVLNLNSPAPAMAPRQKPTFSYGPAFRFRNDRNNRISDDVVARAGKLDAALEVGGAAGIAFSGVIKPFDTLIIGAQVRHDVLGAHDGLIIEPQIGYRAPISRSAAVQVQASAEIIDDKFADYYFTVTPAQALATGLPQFRASGGLNRVGTTAILSYDLDSNLLNGGWGITGIGGYSRLLGDAADTPFTQQRGDANQFIVGLGLAYTF